VFFLLFGTAVGKDSPNLKKRKIMKKLLLVLAMSICGATVFAQDAKMEEPKVENKPIATKGKLIHKLQIVAVRPDNQTSTTDKQKLEDKKVTVANDALMKSAVEQKATIKSEDK